MTNPNFVSSSKLGVNFYKVHPTAQHRLGEIVHGTNGSVWVYAQAGGVIAQYDVCVLDETFQAVAITTTNAAAGWSVAAAQVAFADNEYGWFCRSGTGVKINVLTLAAADGPLYTTATAGKLDDTATTLVSGLQITTTAGGGTEAEDAILNYPFVAEGTFP